MLTAIDLYAGAGGATQGLRQAGFSVLAAVELDAVAVKTYQVNHPSVIVLNEDIQNVGPNALMTRLGLIRGELDLLNACPPCQGFSSLGKRDSNDERNELVLQTLKFVQAFGPKVVIIENVPGLRRDRRFHTVSTYLSDHGYTIRSYIVDAADFGVPQTRRRLILLGVRDAYEDSLPLSLFELLPKDFSKERQLAIDWIKKAGTINQTTDPIHKTRKCSPAVQARIASIPEGGSRFDLPAEHILECHKGIKGATAAYGRIAADDVAPTITTRCTTASCGRFIHPTENRTISLREAALLQTFPSAYFFAGSYGNIERQIGNAFPVRLAEAFGFITKSLLQRYGHYSGHSPLFHRSMG